ncbi:MAG: PadR family transcriptional regulator [Solirubrobacteraceae bacterium]
MSTPRLTETSYIVLGMLERLQPATPYDLKRLAQMSTINFWSVPHTQLYTECARLARAGLLCEHREQTGRRRRIYNLTEDGARALEQWRSQPTEALEEVRDEGLLKLFFGADPAALAVAQLDAHRRQLLSYEHLHEGAGEMPHGMRLALEAGIGHEREFIRFWSELSETGPPAGDAAAQPLQDRHRR